MINNPVLAINGGKKLIDFKFSSYNSIGSEELEASNEVVKSGILSDFVS